MYPRSSQFLLLLQDIRQSIVRWRFWTFLGWNDIAKQYRRSFVGPVWITLNTALFVVAFGFIGAQLFKMDVEDYLPYFSAGHVLFSFMSSLVNEGCGTFTGADAFLKQTPYPKLAFVLRVVWRNLIMLGHNMVIVLGVLAWSGRLGGVQWPWLALGLMLALLSATFVVAILGVLAARFRDVPMAVSSIMQISFFVTPVMWKTEQLTERAKIVVHFNPLASYLELLRAPLLGGVPDWSVWVSAMWSCLALVLIFVALYVAARRRIVYWL
jgi:lipopolysaccharide transport system permease protein